MIPILELKTQYAQIQAELEEAVLRALRSTHYILGPEVENLEAEFKSYHDIRHAVGVGSGTEALHLAIRALGIGPGDEVLCPTFTFVATAGAVSLTGARPVFVDIDPVTFTMDPGDLERRITPRTRAIVVVHLYGLAADLDPILTIARSHNLAVVEDCAQATGAEYRGRRVGTLGDIGCFSFFPSKNLGGVGDGGMVLTHDESLEQAVRMLRGHGSRQKYLHEVLGTNSRLDEIQAAALRVKLRYLDRWNELRRAVADRYREDMAGFPLQLPAEPEGRRHVYHQFTVRSAHRDQLMDSLKKDGIGAVIYYPVSLHLQELYAGDGHAAGDFPASEQAQEEVLSLPMYPELDTSNAERVVSSLGRFFASRVARAS